VAQSMAVTRTQNIHVAHLVIDAGVDTAFVRERIAAARAKRPWRSCPRHPHGAASIAETYWNLHRRIATPGPSRSIFAFRGALVMASMIPNFLFDFGSPNAYLAHKIIPKIEQRAGVKFAYTPVLLAASSRRPATDRRWRLSRRSQQARLRALETRRFVARHVLAPSGPIHTSGQYLAIMRGRSRPKPSAFSPDTRGGVRPMWETDARWTTQRSSRDPCRRRPPRLRLIELTGDRAVKERLIANTASPSNAGSRQPHLLRRRGDVLWQDRLEQVEEAIVTAK